MKMRMRTRCVLVCSVALALVVIPVAFAVTVSGSIANSDPTQTGRLTRNGLASSCATPKPNPGLYLDLHLRHYDAYTYTNTSATTQCVTVTLTTTCDFDALDAAYTSFDPSNPSANYLADPGVSGPSTSFSFNAAAHSSFDVVVLEADPGVGCAGYTLDVTGAGIFGGTPPTSKEQCMNDGWKTFGVFKNQGDCVSFVASGGKNPPAHA